MTYRFCWIVFLFLSSFVVLHAQNITKNYSFETFVRCPSDITIIPKKNFIRHWYNPGLGTPDYYNACSKRMGVPNNIYGTCSAVDGQAYVALIMRSDLSQYREYIQQKLKKKMQKGDLYCVSFHTALAEFSMYYTNRIGLHFSTDSLLVMHDKVLPVDIHLEQSPDTLMLNYGQWHLIKGVYEAKGGEEFITIGNFRSDEETLWRTSFYNRSLPEYQRNLRVKAAYYFVDKVNVIKINEHGECADFDPNEYKQSEEISYFDKITEQGKDIKPGQNIILSNILFELNKAQLRPESYKELNQLVMFLKSNQSLKIEISGHTDYTGKMAYNNALSAKRANAVRLYLIKQGVLEENIQTKGYGSKFPIADNKTPKGRALNRRVEFRIIK